jgi:glutathione S-transferase
MTTATPTLLHFQISHYNEKVRWALDHKRWPHRRVALCPGFHVVRVRRLTGQNKLPVLILDGRPLVESSAILQEIERRRPDPPLYPADPVERQRALGIERFFDDDVAPDLRRLFWAAYIHHPAECARMTTMGFGALTRVSFRTLFPIIRPVFSPSIGLRREQLGRARARLGEYFDRIEKEIGPSGYLVGDRFSIADLAVASIMTAILRPPESPYPIPEPWPPELVELRQSVSHRDGCRWVMEMYAKHRGTSAEVADDTTPLGARRT